MSTGAASPERLEVMRVASLKLVALAAGAALVLSSVRAHAADPLAIIAYGDTRFTDTSNTTASNPAARRALVARIADERPDAIIVSGDVPWHGGTVSDYDEYPRGDRCVARASPAGPADARQP